MILDFGTFVINEASLKKLKREVHGVLNMSARKRMRKELRNNIITFKFRKRNGEIRTAHGTLHPDYLPPLRGGAPRPEKQMVYYDLDKEGWRSFRSFTFIKILNVKPIDGSEKPVHKPVSKPIHKEEEEVKKTTPVKKVEKEKEKEKEVHTEEKKEKKKLHEIDDEIEDDDDKKSILDDKETPEEEEVIKKDKEKEKDEKEDKDKDKEEE